MNAATHDIIEARKASPRGSNHRGHDTEGLTSMRDNLTHEFYWAAGFLEGEGSFGVTGSKHLQITCPQKEIEPLERLQRVIGGKIYKFVQKGRTYHRLCLVGNKATEPMMLKFRPLMSTRRQGQIDKAIAARVIGDPANMGRKNREKTACPNGHEYDVVKWEGRKGGGVGIHRRCSTCDKAAAEARKAARNARLRERYQTDPEFRERKIAESRAARKVTA